MSDSIRIDDFSGGYTNKEVLKNLSLSIGQGGFTAIAGPNGSGKSTLLKYLIRQLKAENSRIEVFGADINSYTQKQLARQISFQSQNPNREDAFTVREVVELGRFAYSDMNRSKDLVDNALRAAGIINLENKLITEISGGEFQLAMLARTICQDSNVMLLDEPINNLDPCHQRMLLKQLKTLSENGKTVICVLHDLNAILHYCDKCILLKDGQVYVAGDTSSVLTPQNIKAVYSIEAELVTKEGRSFILFD